MKLNAILFWILAGIVILASTQSIKAETTKIKLNCDNSPKVCGTQVDAEFIVYVDMGTVVKTDSLYGFDFQLIYDSKKIQLTDFLTIGCLAEKCTYKNVSYNGDTIKGYATRMDFYALTGSKPLFAFKGKVKDNSTDSALIKIDYIEFTDEYAKPFEIDEEFYLKVERIEKRQNKLIAKFESDSIYVSSEYKNIPQELTITYNGVDFLENAKLRLKAEKIMNMLSIDEMAEGISKEIIDNNTVELNYSGNPAYSIVKKVKLSINAEYLANINNLNKVLTAEFIQDRCKCIGAYNDDSLRIISEKSNVNEITEDYSNVHINKILRISNQYKYMKLFNATGSLVFDGEIIATEMDFGIYENGFYLAAMYDENQRLIKTIKIIKYSFIN